jgi:hypothetical protein
MVTNVIVLGAGASRHYGFPLARGLIDRACDAGYAPREEQLAKFGLNPAAVTQFIQDVTRSGCTSIDHYVDYIDDVSEIRIGKVLIAYLLAFEEQPAALFHRGRTDHWYEILANSLIGDRLDTFPERDVAIITFNYERSLEQYLLECLRNRFRARHDVSEIFRAFARLPLIHVYGTIGYLPGLGPPPGGLDRAYGPIVDSEGMNRAISAMRLLREVRGSSSPAIDQARQHIREASGSISFLGFAYSHENLSALQLQNRKPDTVVRGTCFEMVGDQLAELSDRLRRCGGASLQPPWGLTVYEAFRQYARTVLGSARMNPANVHG